MFYTYVHTMPNGKIFYVGKGSAELMAAGFQNPNVYKCINGKRKSHKGHTFNRVKNI